MLLDGRNVPPSAAKKSNLIDGIPRTAPFDREA